MWTFTLPLNSGEVDQLSYLEVVCGSVLVSVVDIVGVSDWRVFEFECF